MEQIEAPKKKKGNPNIAWYAKVAGTQWKPGQSGNPRGRTPEKLITDALKGIYSNPEELARFIRAAHSRACKGHVKFWELIADRLEGKVMQQIEHTGNIIHEITSLEQKMAKDSLHKIRALQSEAENPLLAEVVDPEEK
jgi:hypothetical protein